MPDFMPGLELSRLFYGEAVRPILAAAFPGLPYAAARVGSGSDVLGFDTPMSMDHEWGPILNLFLREEDRGLAGAIDQQLSQQLPHVFRGFPVDFEPVPDEPGVAINRLKLDGPVKHRIFITSARAFVLEQLEYDLNQPLEAQDWLTIPAQKLRGLTAGAVYYDGVGQLTELRNRLAWYPRDVWLYLLASGWARIGQEEHLMPRAGFAGDELGSAIIGARLVRDLMNLCFLMEKVYPPYPKWFGTAFQQLQSARDLSPYLQRVLQASSWQEREAALCQAYECAAHIHNALGITGKMPETVSNFHGRPFRVIHGEIFAQAICQQIADPSLQRLARKALIGSIDQFSDSTDLRSEPGWRAALKELYLE